MKRIILILSLIIGSISSLFSQQKKEIIFCGSNKVIIAQQEALSDSVAKVIWEWDSHTAMQLPKLYRDSLFEKIDECKPISNGKEILITSSTGGVAILRRDDKSIRFYTNLPQAHSAEILPGNKLVVAGSVHEKGNCIKLYDLSGDGTPLFSDSLYSGHGVIWDEQREILYALGGDELRFYQLKNWSSATPTLHLTAVYKIPEKSGHDLQMMPNKKELLLTTEHNVWTFSLDTKKIEVYKPLEKQKDVKSASLHPTTQQLIYTKAEQSWWAFHIRFLFPQSTISYPAIQIYKARWFY